MRKTLIAMAAAAVGAAGLAGAATAQHSQGAMAQQRHGQMMQGGGMMGGQGMMGTERGMRPHMMVMMALADTDGDGALSLDEVQAVHSRIFAYADTDDDGKLTLAEIRAFLHGGPTTTDAR